MNWFSHVVEASCISRGRARRRRRRWQPGGSHNPSNTLIEACCPGLPCTFLIYDIMLWTIDTCKIELSADQYQVTISVSSDHIGLKFIAHQGHVFYYSWPLTQCWFSIGSRAHVKSTCWKRSRVAWKPVNSNPSLKVNQIITVSSLQMLCLQLLFCNY